MNNSEYLQIKNNILEECTNKNVLGQLIIPDSVIKIDNWAFTGCEKLTSIIIPNSVTTIEQWAFNNCYKLKNIIIPNRLTELKLETFADCKSLKWIYIPKSVNWIIEDCFYGCNNLKIFTNHSSLPKDWDLNESFEKEWVDKEINFDVEL